MKNLVKFTALAAVVFGASSVAGAQQTPGTQGGNNSNVVSGATITAHAIVQTAISATGVSDLDFGTIYRGGGAKTIAANSAAAGVFTVAGPIGGTPQVDFTGPTGGNLVGGSASAPTLGITLTYAKKSGTGACTTGTTAFSTGGTITLDASGNGQLCVGGFTAVPGASQALDTYTGTVTMTVTF